MKNEISFVLEYNWRTKLVSYQNITENEYRFVVEKTKKIVVIENPFTMNGHFIVKQVTVSVIYFCIKYYTNNVDSQYVYMFICMK